MAHIRSLSTRVNLLTRRCHSSIGYFLHHSDEDTKLDSVPKGPPFSQHRAFGFTNSSLLGSRRCFDFSFSPTIGAFFSRKMSSSIEEGTDKFELMTDFSAEVLSDSTVQAVASQAAPVVNEVAIAAADSVFPVALLQHFIDSVHSFTGLNWWASIVLTTLAVKGAVLPLMVNQSKASSRFRLTYPRWKEIQQKVKNGDLKISDGDKQLKMLFKEYNVTHFTPFMGLFIQFPIFICFFLALSNMAEKVPSFKTGGAYWFLDLSTPDTLHIFPVLIALTFLIILEAKTQKGLDGNPVAGTVKNVFRCLAVLSVPLTMGLPKAIFCYWVTSHIFSLAYGLALRHPGVKQFLGPAIVPVTPPVKKGKQEDDNVR